MLSGFLLNDVLCQSCGGRHDLFVGELISPHDRYRYTCPKTERPTTSGYDRTSQIVASQPEGSVSAVRAER